MNPLTFLGQAAAKSAIACSTGGCGLALLAIFAGLAPTSFAQSITYPADGTPVIVASGATVSTAIRVTGGGVISCTSNNPAVATATNTTGTVTVTGVSYGSATLTYTITGGTSRTLAVTVIDPAVVLPSNLFVNDVVVGRAATFTLQTFPAGGALTATSTSSNPAIATVSHLDATTLRVAGVALGAATITLTASINGSALTHIFTVNVRNPYVSTPAEGASFAVPEGGHLSVNVFTIPNGGTLSSASVANPAIGRTSFSGRRLLLTGLAPGTTTVTYQTTIDGYTATNTLALTVNAATGAAQSITFADPGSPSVGTRLSLSATSDAAPSHLIRFAVLSGTGLLDGATYTPMSPGAHVLRAFHNGDAAVRPAYQDISFTAADSLLVPGIQWSAGAAIVPGTALGVTQLNAQAVDPQGHTIPGNFVYIPAAGTVLGIGPNQTLSSSFTPADPATFSSATATTTITVGGAAVDPGLVWATPSSITYGTALDATQLNATARTPGTFLYSPAAGTVLDAGDNQPLSVTFFPFNTTNYTGATATTTIVVTKAQPMLVWNKPRPIPYGLPLGSNQLNATSSVPGSFVYSPAAGTLPTVGRNQSLSVTFTPADTTNYNSATKSQTVDVNPASPVVTWAAPTTITYGTVLSSTQLNATSSVPGTFTYTPAAGTVLSAGSNQALGVTFTPSDSANYYITTALTTLSVNPATPVITWQPPAAISYGALLSSAQLNATTSVPGTFVYSPAAGTFLDAGGDQPLSVTFTPTDATNYRSATASTTITIARAQPTIIWPAPATITYGTALDATQLNATASVPGTFVYSPAAGTVLDAGTNQTLNVTFTPSNTANYNSVSASTTLTVAKAQPTLAWPPPAVLTYGTALSATQLNATASVPGTFVYSPAAGTVLNAGTNQTLSVTFTPSNTANYNSASASTTLTVAKAQPTVTWPAPAALTYGTALSATQLNATASVPGTFAYSPAAGTVLDAGANQTLSVTFTPSNTANYNSASASTTLTVAKAQPTLAWPAPASITYGVALGATQLNATASVPGTFAYSPAAGTVLDAGANQALSVTFTPSNTANYNSATASTTITVNASSAALTWNPPAAITYGTPLSATQLNATASVPGTFAYTPASGAVLVAGAQTLSVTFTPTDTANYSPSTRSVSLTVNRAPLTVTAIDATRLAGTPNPAFTASHVGFVNGDTPAVVTGLSFSTTATAASPAGTYPITPSGASAANYQISFVAGTLTVSPATQTVTLTHGAVSVSAGNTAAINAATAAALSFTATGGATGVYTWAVDGVPQPTTGGTLTTSFLTPGSYTVSVLATADPGHAASPAATITVAVAAGEFWTVAAGSGHTLALMGDGTVRAWGRNDRGQLGNGTITDQPTAPVTTAGISGAIAIAAGGSHSLAISNDGSVWAWGGNDQGQLGNDTVLGQSTPIRLTALAGPFVQIAAGTAHTLALRSDGTVWSWGANSLGQLGDGTTTQRNVPVLLAGLTDAVAIAAGANHSLAVRADGTVWTWGGNGSGQLGDGTTTSRSSPLPLSIAAAHFVDIAGGDGHTLALADNGTVWAWGDNAAGQLGDAMTTVRPTPAPISGLTNVARLAAGRAHSAALKLDGTLWSWGDNHDGQLGDGTTTALPSPTKVNGVTDAVDQAAGGNRTVLVTLDGAVRILGSVPGPIIRPDQRIAQAPLRLVPSTSDTDQDGMPDTLELQYFGDLNHSGAGDSDGDSLADVQELFLGTNPVAPYDHDPDPTLSVVGGNHQVALTGQFNAQPFDVAVWSHDGARPLVNASVTFTVASGGGLLATTNLGSPALTSSLTQVTDVDGTVKVYYRQPSVAYVSSQVSVVAANSQISLSTLSTGASDTDGNRLLDTWEDRYFGADHPPVDSTADPDHDGLTNLVEMTAGTSPVNPDSDSDGMNDGPEYHSGRNPLDAIDSVPLPLTYLLVMKTPDAGYLGLKSNWTVTSVNAP